MYNPKEHWDEIGRVSSAGHGEDPGKFGIDEGGNSLYKLPLWSSEPQYWEYMGNGVRVLDIGSGNGLQVGRLAQRGIFSVGCDISPALLAVARENMRFHGVTEPMLVQWDGLRLPFAPETFDRVTTNTVLQHVVDDRAFRQMFSDVNRILKTGGLFLICELVWRWNTQTAPHVKLRSAEEYKSLAGRYNFCIRYVRHAPSTYATMQAVYGYLTFHRRPSQPSSSQTASPDKHYVPRPYRPYTRRAVSKAASIIAGIMDPLIALFCLDGWFVSQDTIVCEKGHRQRAVGSSIRGLGIV